LVFDNVQVKPTAGPVFKLTDSQDITIRQSVAPERPSCFSNSAAEHLGP
jgi:hypothetical protein